MFDIALFEPEIPPNTGNIIRLAANTGCRLHLVEPLGFALEDKSLRRAGLDYHEYATISVHRNYADLLAAVMPTRVLALTTRGSVAYDGVRYRPSDLLLFGPETRGLPASVRDDPDTTCVRIPMLPASRSLNLSNAVAVVVYEAWRQRGFTGAV